MRWKYNINMDLRGKGCKGWELDGTGLGACPMTSSVISGIELSGSTTRELVFYTSEIPSSLKFLLLPGPVAG
jgi:hypothetical protein